MVSDFDWGKTLLFASLLQPNAREVVVISGASDYDKLWHRDAVENLQPYLSKYPRTYLSGLPYEELLERVSRLSADTIVLLLSIFQDGAGQPRVPPEVATDVARLSPAPVYSAAETLFGHGIVGGYLDSFETQGVAAADLAVEILAGKDPSGLPRRTTTLHRYQADARQLHHWHLSENRVPGVASVFFKEPTLWDQHRGFRDCLEWSDHSPIRSTHSLDDSAKVAQTGRTCSPVK